MDSVKSGERRLIFGERCDSVAEALRRRRHVRVHRKGHQYPMRQSPIGPTGAGPSPLRDGGDDLVGGGLVPAVDPERATPSHTHQNSAVGVKDHRHFFRKAVHAEPRGQSVDHDGRSRPYRDRSEGLNCSCRRSQRMCSTEID